MNDATNRILSSAFAGAFFDLGGHPLRERPRPSFFARAQAAIPQIDERRESRLQRGEAEAIAVVLDDAAIEPLDHRLDAAARLPRRARKPAGEIHVVFPFQLPEVAFEDLQLAIECFWFGHLSVVIGSRQSPHRGIKNQMSGSHSSRA